MLELIKKGAKLSEENRVILWVEAVLFAAVLALAMQSWAALAVLFAGLAFIMTRRNGMFWAIFALSALWALIPFCMGLAAGGVGWAAATGALVFLWALKVHTHGLKWHWDEVTYKADETIEWMRITWCGRYASRGLV